MNIWGPENDVLTLSGPQPFKREKRAEFAPTDHEKDNRLRERRYETVLFKREKRAPGPGPLDLLERRRYETVLFPCTKKQKDPGPPALALAP